MIAAKVRAARPDAAKSGPIPFQREWVRFLNRRPAPYRRAVKFRANPAVFCACGEKRDPRCYNSIHRDESLRRFPPRGAAAGKVGTADKAEGRERFAHCRMMS